MIRSNFLKLTLLAPLAALFGWKLKPDAVPVYSDGSVIGNAVASKLAEDPLFEIPPDKYDGSRSYRLTADEEGNVSIEWGDEPSRDPLPLTGDLPFWLKVKF